MEVLRTEVNNGIKNTKGFLKDKNGRIE